MLNSSAVLAACLLVSGFLAGCENRSATGTDPLEHVAPASQTGPAELRERAASAPGPVGAEPLDWSYLDARGVLELDWLQLLPADEVDALSEQRPVSHEGSTRMAQSGSDRVVPAVLGLPVRIPGYVVPLETDAEGRVIELFLVPYYGACIHVPPPPPNQIVHVTLASPVRVGDIYEPFWIEGTLTGEATDNEIAGTAYSMRGADLMQYTDK